MLFAGDPIVVAAASFVGAPRQLKPLDDASAVAFI